MDGARELAATRTGGFIVSAAQNKINGFIRHSDRIELHRDRKQRRQEHQ